MSSSRKLAAVVGATVAASAVLVLPASPAFAATCRARVSFGVSSGTGSATEFNSGESATRCALVQVRIRGYLGAGIYQDYLGPQSNSSSHREASANSYTWYGKAKPSVASPWKEHSWGTSGEWKLFQG